MHRRAFLFRDQQAAGVDIVRTDTPFELVQQLAVLAVDGVTGLSALGFLYPAPVTVVLVRNSRVGRADHVAGTVIDKGLVAVAGGDYLVFGATGDG